MGITARNASRTFNTLPVHSLGRVPERSEIVDAEGKVIAYYYPHGLYRIPVTYHQIAPVMRHAIVAIEDSRFYQHGAIDFRGTLRALVADLTHTSVQGGSTLAQQYVKNTCILTARDLQAAGVCYQDTLARKIRELRIAANVEHEMTRDQILTAYLNAAYFDNNAYGIQVAAGRYFSVSADQLTLDQAATLAGLVENPVAYNPFAYPATAVKRRNTVLARMAQLRYITHAQAVAAGKAPLGLHPSTIPLQTGCTAPSASGAAFFCSYVMAVLSTNPAYKKAWAELNGQGGLRIVTTMDAKDQRAAQNAVDYVEPPHSSYYNPGRNADTEVMVQPRTGKVRAIAVNRRYGFGRGQDSVNYAVNTAYGGSTGVLTGSSMKIFTLVTALEQGVPFGFSMKITSPETIGGYTNCKGQPLPPYSNLSNAEGNTPRPEIYSLYTGTTQSINVFYAHLEQRVGLCNVVRTAAKMGMTRADGRSLLKYDPDVPAGQRLPIDNYPSFTLGAAVNVSPMSMAAAYASVAGGGIYCSPEAIERIETSNGTRLPVQSARCHRDMPSSVAAAADYILQGVLINGTAGGQGIGRPAGGKTGTGDQGDYAAFAGFTPTLAGYVSVFNPISPTGSGRMLGSRACYRASSAQGGSLDCPGDMYGANAPASTWQMSFLHAALGPARSFPGVPPGSPFFREGNGRVSPTPPSKPKPGKPGKPGRPIPPTRPGHGRHH
jgi:membrane peptidoglycan carboxypeptidase